ncbi:MAG: hypothetical protein K5757_04930 [Bacteroidaceae bacterium]|nr:hypothetical protein [Bacteroidaceae bacterium]
MWKETKVVKNVRYFYSFDARYGVYATTDKNDKSILFIADKEIPISEAGDIRSYDDKVVVQVDDGAGMYDTMLFTKDGELLNVVKNTYSLDRNTNLRYMNVALCEDENHVDYNNLVDIETGKMIFKESYQRTRKVFDNMVFTNENNIVTRYDWDGSILWQHNYEPDFNVKINLGFVMEGVCGGKLWVKSKVDRHEILLAIDVNTGELVKAFSDSEEDTDLPHCNIGDIGFVFLNLENNHILVVTSDKEGNAFLNFVDAKTVEVFERTPYAIDSDNSENVYILEGISEFKEDYITFKLYNSDRDYNASGFLIYNYKTKKVVYVHHIFTSEQTNDGWMVFKVQYQNNIRIFAYDFAKRLHIFEDVKE